MAHKQATPGTILVVDDEPSICWGFDRLLSQLGHRVISASSAEEGLVLAKRHAPQLILLDVRLPGEDGLSALPKFIKIHNECPIVVMTAFGDLETAVAAMRGGAADYLTKPFKLDDALQVCQAAMERGSQQEPLPNSRDGAHSERLVGSSAPMQQVYRDIAMIADSDLPVLITGEAGTGKELIATAIQTYSSRRDKLFLTVSPAIYQSSLVESELFGHVRGAVLGADQDRDGLLMRAAGGTVLIDEVSELSPAAQLKLLRLIERKELIPAGDIHPRPCDVRILATTHVNLLEKVESDAFRKDLYYRLAVVHIHAPPLRYRLDDLPELVESFLRQVGHARAGYPIARDVLERLRSRSWTGNVRELRNAVERAAVMSRGGDLAVDHFPEERASQGIRPSQLDALDAWIEDWTKSAIGNPSPSLGDLYERFLAAVEPTLFRVVLNLNGGNRAAAATMLGIHRGTLRERLKRYNMDEG